ncbi:MAG: hypothetical protein ACXWT0_00435 [Methylobacter sp.]
MDWIEKLAREHGTGGWQTLADMVLFGEAVAAAEREACAKVCETLPLTIQDHNHTAPGERTLMSIAEAGCRGAFSDAIRARSNALK